MRNLVVILVVFLMWPGVVLANQDATETQDRIDPKTYSCADHLRLTGERDGRSDVRIVWAHGYYSGLRGIDKSSPAITVQDFVEFSGLLAEACKENPKKLFVAAVKDLAEKNP
jgi:hypothetical protein